MKRAASKTDVRIFESRPDPLFCQSPPRCEFYDEDGCARREFDSLSTMEKEKVMKDIYGIEEQVEETPEVVREGLEKMNNMLLDCVNKKESLMVARDRFPSFFEDEAFRLQFLRVDAFDAKLASNRLVRHIEKKMKLFGPDLLGKKIKLEHLSDDDMDFMRSGGLQVVPAKDRGGRHLMFSSHRKWKYKEVKNVLRCMWYMLMVLVEESGTNICDTVEISYNLGQFSAGAFDRSALKSVFDLFKATPSRLVGYHYCFDDVRFRMVYGVITVFLGKKARMRARDHEGSHVECRYGLMSYGIPVDELSVMSDGLEDNSKFNEWLEERTIKENEPQEEE
mmetsp:Transcript_116667/g.336977  ORF Transcript_116667/g.336977 Transcript_116667/m.336977 type:complete len:336 (+) Transcript_116667:138-1145(+)